MQVPVVSKPYNFLSIRQPVGEFYLIVMDTADLIKISWTDRRKIVEGKRDVVEYTGIQRKLNPTRVESIANYVKTDDATFPSAVILSVRSNFVEMLDRQRLRLRISEDVAKIIDGQHRIEGLVESGIDAFQVPVTLFVDADLEIESMLFATINLEQTKVNRSLAIDLQAYATSRSPLRSAHIVVKILNEDKSSPFFHKIKMLGVNEFGTELVSQATFADRILNLISDDPLRDKVNLRNNKKLDKPLDAALLRRPLMGMFRSDNDGEIATVLFNYFSAIRSRWPDVWDNPPKFNVLTKTTGFNAFMNFFPDIYNFVASPGQMASKSEFDNVFNKITIGGESVVRDKYPPGSAGQAKFANELRAELKKIRHAVNP